MLTFSLSAEEIKAKYGKGDSKREQIFVQAKKIISDLQSSILFVVGNGTWALIIQVLLMAILFKLLFLSRSYLYAEHIIFHTYGHTRFLLVGLIFLVAGLKIPFGEYWGLLTKLWIICGALYLYAGMKAYYSQSKRKTFLKWLLTLCG